jgi:hypothetical protein
MLELRAATAEDRPWLEQLITSDGVEPFLATDAAAGLGAAIAAAELLIAEQPAGERYGLLAEDMH